MTAQSHYLRGLSHHQNNETGQDGALSDHAAALRGASLAFRAPPLKPKPLTNTYTGAFGAIAAAKKAESEDKLHSNGSSIRDSHAQTDILPDENKGGAGARDLPLAAAEQSVHDRLQVLADSRKHTSSLEIPLDGRRSVSPSNIAATLAAARSASQTPHVQTPSRSRSNTMSDDERKEVLPASGTVRNKRQLFAQTNGDHRDGEHHNQSRGQSTSRATTEEFQDKRTIGPANRLIGLYEQKNTPTTRDGDNFPLLKSTSAAPIIRSPKPYRPPSSNIPPVAAALSAVQTRSSSRGAAGVIMGKSKITPNSGAGHPTVSVRYTGKDSNHGLTTAIAPRSTDQETPRTVVSAGSSKGKLPPEPPVSRKPLRSESSSTISKTTLPVSKYESDDSSIASYATAIASPSKPALPPPRRTGPKATTTNPPDKAKPPLRHAATDEPGSISQKGLPKPKPIDIPQRGLKTSSRPLPLPKARSWVEDLPSSGDGSKYRSNRGKQQAFPHMTEDSLANAIVASSLASSRASSPAVSPQPPPPARHSKHHYFHHDPPTPSPPKAGMRQTMRGPPRSDDDDEPKRGRKNLVRKHPHKHHEADRKRWRDQLTERERKRYEGVWAANKGLHVFLSSTEPSQLPPSQQPLAGKDHVAGPVVREIWSRSRLPHEVLQEVWELVDGAGVGTLDREEFVVGLWLVDQSLKGRKLPIKVSESVWGSVRRLGGIKAPKGRK